MPRMSERVDELFAAFVEAQKEFGTAIKDKRADLGKGGRYTYADLEAVVGACLPALHKHGLSVFQPTGVVKDDEATVVLETLLAHRSGQWISSTFTLRPTGTKHQEMGSAITYARRYSLAALVGVVADDDDDGASADRREEPRRERRDEREPERGRGRDAERPIPDDVEQPYASPTPGRAVVAWVVDVERCLTTDEVFEVMGRAHKALSSADYEQLRPVGRKRVEDLEAAEERRGIREPSGSVEEAARGVGS